MNKCWYCKYYDESVAACNADEDNACYMDGYQQGRKDAIDELLEYLNEWLDELNKCKFSFRRGIVRAIISKAEQIKESK